MEVSLQDTLQRVWQEKKFSERPASSLARDQIAARYQVVMAEGQDATASLIGLSVKRFGRLGNNLVQLARAIALARALNVAYLRVANFELFDIREPVCVPGLTLLPEGYALPTGGVFLEGDFFRGANREFGRWLSGFTAREIRGIVRADILPLMMIKVGEKRDESELVIHVRSGDVFTKSPPGYGQPPLSYYTRIVEDLLTQGTIDKVCVVSEDRLNPCVDALFDYLKERSVPCSHCSGTLHDDILRILGAEHVVFGFGSFGVAMCYMTDHFRSVHAYETHTYERIPDIGKVTLVSAGDGYIKRGQWNASAEQCQMMLSFPADGLVWKSVNSDAR